MTKKSSAPKSPTKNPPQKQVLLLSCMDLRLADDTTRFMDAYNLQNRYDHLTFAGAAMGVRNLGTPIAQPDGRDAILPWKAVFFQHFKVAIEELNREIKDVFLVEHLDCGAYKKLHPDVEIRREYEQHSLTNMKKLVPYHKKEALGFAKEVLAFCEAQQSSFEQNSKRLRELLERNKVEGTIEEHYRKLFDSELKANAWRGISVRSYVLDLKGNPIELL